MGWCGCGGSHLYHLYRRMALWLVVSNETTSWQTRASCSVAFRAHPHHPSVPPNLERHTAAPLREILGRLYDMGACCVSNNFVCCVCTHKPVEPRKSTPNRPTNPTHHPPPQQTQNKRTKTGVREHVMVEGGPRTARAFLETKVVDRVVIYQVNCTGICA